MFSEASRSPTSFRTDESSSSTARKRAKPTSKVEDVSVLSKQLQGCIDHACDTVSVLDRQKLNVFFTHVKKKSNPLRIALNFTKDTDNLKQQLQAILDRYYSTPQTSTKEDIQFIKWLNGLVERFDGTIPRKRKPYGRSSGEPPSKK